jgi:hypothetical protein
MFTFRGKVEHFLALHLSDEHVTRFQKKGIYALQEMIKELIDAVPFPVSNGSEPVRSATLLRSPMVETYKPFEKIYNQYKDELGPPKGEAEPLKHAYLAQYDKAQVIWDENAGELYRLHMRDGVWVAAKDLLNDDPSWYDDMKNRERFGLPEGQLPPWGGPARLRAVNRKDWEIGSRHWHFYHVGGATFVQRFEKGLIIGPFRRSPSDKDGAQVYALTGEGTHNRKWHRSVSLGVSDLLCVEPMSLVPAPTTTPERLSAPSGSVVPNPRQEKVDGWRDMITEAKSKFKQSGLSLFAILEQDARFESFKRHLSTGALQALKQGTGVRSSEHPFEMLDKEITRIEESWGLRLH